MMAMMATIQIERNSVEKRKSRVDEKNIYRTIPSRRSDRDVKIEKTEQQ